MSTYSDNMLQAISNFLQNLYLIQRQTNKMLIVLKHFNPSPITIFYCFYTHSAFMRLRRKTSTMFFSNIFFSFVAIAWVFLSFSLFLFKYVPSQNNHKQNLSVFNEKAPQNHRIYQCQQTKSLEIYLFIHFFFFNIFLDTLKESVHLYRKTFAIFLHFRPLFVCLRISSRISFE